MRKWKDWTGRDFEASELYTVSWYGIKWHDFNPHSSWMACHNVLVGLTWAYKDQNDPLCCLLHLFDPHYVVWPTLCRLLHLFDPRYVYSICLTHTVLFAPSVWVGRVLLADCKRSLLSSSLTTGFMVVVHPWRVCFSSVWTLFLFCLQRCSCSVWAVVQDLLLFIKF